VLFAITVGAGCGNR